MHIKTNLSQFGTRVIYVAIHVLPALCQIAMLIHVYILENTSVLLNLKIRRIYVRNVIHTPTVYTAMRIKLSLNIG